MLKIDNLCCVYDDTQVLKNVSLEVNNGQIVFIQGKPKTGKTTLIKTIAGFIKIIDGSIIFNEEEITKLTVREILRRGIVQIPQGRELFLKMSVLENLQLGVFSKDGKTRFKEILEFVYLYFPDIKKKLKKSVGTLTVQEQELIAVIRAFIGIPELILIEDCFDNLNEGDKKNVSELLNYLTKKQETGILIFENNEINQYLKYDKKYEIKENTLVQPGEI